MKASFAVTAGPENSRILLSFVLFIVAWQISFAQDQERYFHDAQFTFGVDAEVIDSGIYINQDYSTIWESLSYDSYIKKLAFDLFTVDSVSIKPLLGIFPQARVSVKSIKNCGSGHLNVLLYEIYPDTNSPNGWNYYRSHVAQLDQDLNLRWHYRTTVDSAMFVLYNMACFNSGLVLCGRTTLHDNSRSNSLIALDSSGNFVNQYYDFQAPYIGSFAQMHAMDGKLYVSMNNLNQPASDKIVVLNSDLNFQDTVVIIDSSNALSLIGDGLLVPRQSGNPLHICTAYYPTNSANGPSSKMVLATAEITPNNKLAQIDTISFSGLSFYDTTGPNMVTPWINALDYLNTDSLVFAIAGKFFYGGGGPGYYGSNPVYIYNYNAETRQQNWLRVFDNGQSHNSISFTAVLPGNKYLIGVNEFNRIKYAYDNLSLHLMILNANGDLLSERNLEYKSQPVSAYPNPFTNEVQLSGLESAEAALSFRLLSLTGQLIDEGEPDHSGIIRPACKPGVYILQVYQEENLISSSKVIKE